MLDAMDLVAGVLYIAVVAYIFLKLWRKNLFWVHFLGVEYFYLIGLGIFPVLHSFGMVDPLSYFKDGVISIATPLHIMSYALGALIGFTWGRIHPAHKISRVAIRLNLDPVKVFRLILIICLSFFLIYILTAGFEQAVIGASYARSGNFEYFEEGSKYAFLTRPMMIGVLSAAYAYFFIVLKGKPLYFLIGSSIIGISIYIVTISRFAVFQCLIIPMALYVVHLARSDVIHRFLGALLAMAGIIVAYLIFNYGKIIVFQVASYLFFGSPINLDVGGRQGNGLDAFSHLYYSINAGIENFFDVGPEIYWDVLISPLGIVPSAVFANMGLDYLSYQLLNPGEMFSCVNTFRITGGGGDCFVPAYFTGLSAYVFPLAGGFLFGLVRFALYRTISKSWCVLETAGRGKDIPTILAIFYLLEQLMLAIPATISMVVFIILFASFLTKTKIIK